MANTGPAGQKRSNFEDARKVSSPGRGRSGRAPKSLHMSSHMLLELVCRVPLPLASKYREGTGGTGRTAGNNRASNYHRIVVCRIPRISCALPQGLSRREFCLPSTIARLSME